ncbi:MAG: PqqD family protein [Clostridia bacterium]|nr:PqqD family protein [Clostridia bacterium]
MSKKKKPIIIPENYLARIPSRPAAIQWETAEDGTVTLLIENTGWANRLAQKLFDRPKVTRVDLDKTGSFVWPLLDGEKTITEIGKLVDAEFGEAAHPLYERLARYFQILDSYHFIEWVTPE